MDKINQLLTLLKTNRRAQIISASLFIILISLTGILAISWKNRRQIAFEQKPFTHPSPSPRHQTRFANHPTIINIEQDLASVEASVSSLIIQKHPLLPPSIDMQVTLDK